MVVKDLLKISVTNKDIPILNTKYLEDIIPELKKYFGNDRPCKLDITTDSKKIPDLSISTKGIVFQLYTKMAFRCQKADDQVYEDAFTFIVDTKIKANLDLGDNIKIKMKISELAITVLEVQDSHIGDIKIKTINKLMESLLTIIKSLVNLLLQKGLSLGWLINNLPINLKEIKISPADGYYAIQANPYFKTTNEIVEFLEGINHNRNGLGAKNLMSASMFSNGLKKGLKDAYKYFDIDGHIEKLGLNHL